MKRTVIITGASRGLGLELSKRFLECGDRVYGISKTSRAWKEANQFLGPRAKVHWLCGDLSKESDVKKITGLILRKEKRIDILLNNAGYAGQLEPVEKLSLAEFKRNIDQNLTTAFLTAKYFLPRLQKQGNGLILNISSMAGVRAVPRLFGYSASKFGVLALSQAIAKENEKIRCLTVCPGGMNTAMRAKLFGADEAAKQQSAEYVADVIMDVVSGKTPVESGGHIIIRHGKISGIMPMPGQ